MNDTNADAPLKTDTDLIGRRQGRRTRDEDDARTDLTDDDRLEMFRQQLFTTALPQPPDLPGWHMCWLTTTNPNDSIHNRMRLGYEPVRPEEVPGLEYASLKTGEYAGMIGINEMLLFKLPMGLYQKYMQEAHHDAPLREEEKVESIADMIRDQGARDGVALYEGDGMAEMRQNRTRPFVYE